MDNSLLEFRNCYVKVHIFGVNTPDLFYFKMLGYCKLGVINTVEILNTYVFKVTVNEL